MLNLRDQIQIFAATERATGRAGELTTYVEARIRGNYHDGPVPVTVRYHSYFRYNEEWLDEQGNSILASSRDFATAAERDAYNSTHFATVSRGDSSRSRFAARIIQAIGKWRNL